MSRGKSSTKTPTAFHENLRALIGDRSVLAWSKDYGFEQTTIQRIVNGQDPKLSTIIEIARKTHHSIRDLLGEPGASGEGLLSADALRVALRFDRGSPLEKSRFLRLLEAAYDEPRLLGGLSSGNKRKGARDGDGP